MNLHCDMSGLLNTVKRQIKNMSCQYECIIYCMYLFSNAVITVITKPILLPIKEGKCSSVVSNRGTRISRIFVRLLHRSARP